MAFSATPKNKLNAVQRNTAKRRLRELYRLNKQRLETFCAEKQKSFAIMLVYTNHEVEMYSVLEKRFHKLLDKFTEILSSKTII